MSDTSRTSAAAHPEHGDDEVSEEQVAYDRGFSEGVEAGRPLGLEDGAKIGHDHGWSLAVEVWRAMLL